LPPSIRSLLDEPSLALGLVVSPAHRDGRDPLDENVSWVHSSDLLDPTPFLDAGQLLLTDGAQFAPTPGEDVAYEEPVDRYVARLSARGIRGLGFATQVIHDQVPTALATACEAHRLPLLEVRDRTPFIAIIRYVADVIAREQNARAEWSLRAQRSIAHAALRPDGLASILSELERQLGGWVALFDAAGNHLRTPADTSVPPALLAPVTDAARAALARGLRSSSRHAVDGQEVTLQTLGQRNQLRGVLAIGGIAPLDPAGTDLVTSVIALASLALEQNRALDVARGHLRGGVLEQLVAGSIAVASRTATEVWGGLPDEPLRVMAVAVEGHHQFLLESLELMAEDRRGAVFFAPRDDGIIVLTGEQDIPGVRALLARHGATSGMSTATALGDLARGIDEAARALQRAQDAGAPSIDFGDVLGDGMLGMLREENAGAVARRLLRPLIEHDAREGTDLLGTAKAWFANNCAWDQTAKGLGIHRHTLRNRIDTAGGVLGLDLDLVHDRFELWTALHFAPAGTDR